MFDLLIFLWKFLAIMSNENVSHHGSTGSENDDKSPTSPRGSFNGDSTLEEGEITSASKD